MLGALFGIFIFGETAGEIDTFWNSTYMGRFILPDWLGLSTGVVVLLVVIMALLMFWGAEVLERKFGDQKNKKIQRWQLFGAGAMILMALIVMAVGQPTPMDLWEKMAPEKQVLLDERQVQIHPGELLDLIYNNDIKLQMLDVRKEADYNLFHLKDAKLVDMNNLKAMAEKLLDMPDNTVVVLMSNDEIRATEAWKILIALHVPNVYILEGGINNWLDVFGHEGHEKCKTEAVAGTQGKLRHIFFAALGSNHESAEPEKEHLHFKLEYTPKVKLQKKVRKQGGCS